MNLEAVRAFVTVAEEGQFQLAAAHLGISQQAVSKRLASLERDLGVRLFTRTAGGTRPTIDGQAFLPHAASCCGWNSGHWSRCSPAGARCGSTCSAARLCRPLCSATSNLDARHAPGK